MVVKLKEVMRTLENHYGLEKVGYQLDILYQFSW